MATRSTGFTMLVTLLSFLLLFTRATFLVDSFVVVVPLGSARSASSTARHPESTVLTSARLEFSENNKDQKDHRNHITATASSSSSSLSTNSEEPTRTSSTSTTVFEPTVTYATLDEWFHVLSGMEDERITSTTTTHADFSPQPAPAPPKPTDHWMF
jgi:hypothetical protein